MAKIAYSGARIFDGARLLEGNILLLDGELIQGFADTAPDGFAEVALDGGVLMPGFVDLQTNGGGGVMFNDAPSLETLKALANAHWTSGTRGLLPTLISDTPAKTVAAIDAVERALNQDVLGVAGLHLEGPHLSAARKGAHAETMIRPMTPEDEAVLLDAATRIPNLMITIAPESVTPDQVTRLSAAGIVVSLGHSDCRFEEAAAYFEAGAVCVTHLFNAMSQMQAREPGLVGATLYSGVAAGIIADGIHVHPASLAAATNANGNLFLITDAMATFQSNIESFELNGRKIERSRAEHRLTLADGTLAGADLSMDQAIKVMVEQVGVDLESALAMATSRPASLLRDPGTLGTLTPGTLWTGIYLDKRLMIDQLPA
ncbi:MAG: N-acetylglucosamine-6-phosphate deacetylase [Pseudomonadota bacterium]